MTKKIITLTIALLFSASMLQAQPTPDESLARHNFFYAGQSKQRRMFIVRDGQVAWSYSDQLKKGEISDAILMSDGHILVAHQYGIAEVDANGNTLWSYAAPQGTEIHTIQPIGRQHVVFVQNGQPAKVVVMQIPSTSIVREFTLPVAEKGSVHGQFRNARLSSRGTLLVANMGLGCIQEYTSDGKEVDRWGNMNVDIGSQRAFVVGDTLTFNRTWLSQEVGSWLETDVIRYIEPLHICTSSCPNNCPYAYSDKVLTWLPDPYYVVVRTAAKRAEGDPSVSERVQSLTDEGSKLLSAMRENDSAHTTTDTYETCELGYVPVL